jgi:hypothetical protein
MLSALLRPQPVSTPPMYKLLAAASLALLLTSCWKAESLPHSGLSPVLLDEPLQLPVRQPAFQTQVGGIEYTVQPLYRYELAGLVVSRHDSKAWWDYAHAEWKDELNAVDLCVVWGDNVSSSAYLPLNYSSDQWTCHVQTGSSEAWQAFDPTALSNNHLITDQPALAQRLRDARIGDQIRLRGYLAEYSHKVGTGFHRGTSTTRNDTGNGACETIYVEEFEILEPGGKPWRALRWPAAIAFGVFVLLWLRQPVTFRD